MAANFISDTTVFDQIKQQCPKNKVTSLCNSLAKKSSLKSGADCEKLCRLAYWLYVYGYNDLAPQLITPTHALEFMHDYNVWTFIFAMWGLEIRIMRERGETEKAAAIASEIDRCYLMPGPVDTPERMPAKEAKRRARFTVESVTNRDKIRQNLEAGKPGFANNWRFTALLSMIGNTETGLFPNLNEKKNEIEEKTIEYIDELKNVK